jgi:hypothetical protein
MSTSFCRELLPSPRAFYEQELGELRRPSRGWASPKSGCPFHSSRTKKSFTVNLESGGFFCFSCGTKGGDVLAFLRQRYGYDFVTAAKVLGCWRENGRPCKPCPTVQKRYLVMEFTIDDVEYRAEILDEPTAELGQLRRFYADAADRLTEIRQGDAEQFEGEEQTQWGILATSWELIQMESER